MKQKNGALRLMPALKKLASSGTVLTVNELRVVLALERAVARLQADSVLSRHLIFKGGFVLLKTADATRFTRDLDALAIGISRDRIPQLVQGALAEDLVDAVWFGDFEHQDLPNQGDYGAHRITCACQIDDVPPKTKIRKLSRIHIDVGFGDAVTSAGTRKMRSILPGIAPVSWKVYPLEYVFSEKLQTFFERGSANSRAKDLFDLAAIFPKCRNLDRLIRAVRKTFSVRSTALPESFLERAKTFDQTILRSAWKGIHATESEPFDAVWVKFESILRRLDRVQP